MFVVFDLDGTLALTEHREHFLTAGPKKDWRGFYAACGGDAPCHPLIETARGLILAGEKVEIWTGRSDEVAEQTRHWLLAQGLYGAPIRMRKAGDHRPDTDLKREWMEEFGRPDLVFEDRARMVAMWRSHGIVCCQVAPGEF